MRTTILCYRFLIPLYTKYSLIRGLRSNLHIYIYFFKLVMAKIFGPELSPLFGEFCNRKARLAFLRCFWSASSGPTSHAKRSSVSRNLWISTRWRCPTQKRNDRNTSESVYAQGGGGGSQDFRWRGWSNGAKSQDPPKKSLGLPAKPEKIPGLKINPNLTFQTHKSLAKEIKSSLKEKGIPVTVKPIDWIEAVEVLYTAEHPRTMQTIV